MIDSDYLLAVQKLLQTIKPWRGKVPAGYVVDCLGVLTPAAWKAHHFSGIEADARYARYAITNPLRISEKYFEVGNIVLSVEDGGDSFSLVELGAAWGVRTAEAWGVIRSRRPKMPVRLVSVDGQRQHADWREEHFKTNGLPVESCLSVHAAVGTDTRPVFFPDLPGVLGQGKENEDALAFIRRLDAVQARQALESLWASATCGIEEDYQVNEAPLRRTWTIVSSVTLRQILFGFEIIDLMDMDIQGTEDVVLPDAAKSLLEKVKLLHIGTHGRERHARVRDLLVETGWQVLADCPPKTDIETPLGSFRTKDGFVTARNPELMVPVSAIA